MKILHIIERFYPIIGGTEMQALQLIQKLKARGVNIEVLTRNIGSSLSSSEVVKGIFVSRVGPIGLSGGLNKVKFAWNVYKFVKKNDSDILHVHSIYSLFGISCILTGKKVIGKITNSIGTREQNKLAKILKCFILKKINKIVAVSNQTKLEMEKIGFSNSQLFFIPNGVDIDQFKRLNNFEKTILRKKLNLPLTKLIATFSGRLVKQKGLDVLLKAINEVIKEFPDFHLIISGAGELQDNSEENVLKQFVSENNLGTSVTFIGNVYNWVDYLNASDFFFFPSRWEGLPNALLEAAACGLPIIASNIGGNVDIIKDSYNGLLFESENSKELAEKIIYLIKNKNLQQELGDNARKTVIKNFSFEFITKKYLEIYSSLS